MMVLRHIGIGQTPPSATIVHSNNNNNSNTDDEDLDRDRDREEREERIPVGGGGAAIPMDLSNKHSSARHSSPHLEVPRHLKLNNNNNNNSSNKNNNNNININSINSNIHNNGKKPPLSMAAMSMFPTPGHGHGLIGHHHSPVNKRKETNSPKVNPNVNPQLLLNTIIGRPHPSPSDGNTTSLRWRSTTGGNGNGEDDGSYSSPDSGLHRDSPGEDDDPNGILHNSSQNSVEGRNSSSPPSGLLHRSRQSLIPLSLIRARYNHNHSNNGRRPPNDNDNDDENDLEKMRSNEDEDEDREGELTLDTGEKDEDEEDGDGRRRQNNTPGSGKSSNASVSSQSHHRHHIRKDPHQVQTKRARLEEMVSFIKRTTTSPSDERSMSRSRRHSGDDDDTSSGGQGTSGDEIGEDLRATDLRRANMNMNHYKHILQHNNNSKLNSKNNNNNNNNNNNFGIRRANIGPTNNVVPPPDPSLLHPSIPHHLLGGLGGANLNSLKGLPFNLANSRHLFQHPSPDNDHDNDNDMGDEPCNLVRNNNNNNNNNNSGSKNQNQNHNPNFPLSMPDISHLLEGKGAGGILGSGGIQGIPPGLLNAAAAAAAAGGIGGPGGGGGLIPNLNNLKNLNQPLSPSDASKLYGMDPEAYQQHMMQLQLTQAAMMGDPSGLLKGLSMSQYSPLLYLFAPYSQLLHNFQAQEMLRQYAIQSQTPTISQGEKSPTILRSNLNSSSYNCGSPVSPASASEPAGMDSDGSVVGQATGGNGNGKRAPRAMTGRHVRTGTGASPTTLQTLRLKIEERQRLKAAQQLRHDMLQSPHANSNHSNKGKNSKFMKKFKK